MIKTNTVLLDIGRLCAEVLIQSGCTRVIISGKALAVLNTAKRYIVDRYPKASVKICQYKANTFEDVEKVVREAAAIYGTFNYVINCQSLLQVRARPTAETGLEDFQNALKSTSREVLSFPVFAFKKYG